MEHTNITELDEKQLDELLAYTPDYSKESSASIKRMFLQKTAAKRKPGKRVLLAAAVAAIALAFSVTALAATGVIDFGRFYNSIFSNSEASQHIVPEEMISVVGDSGELTIRPISGFMDGEWRFYVQLELTMPDGVPIPETLYILDGEQPINLGEVTITEMDERTAVISFRPHIGQPLSETGTVTLKFDAVSSVWYSVDNESLNSAPVAGAPGSLENVFTYYGDWEFVFSITNAVIPGTYYSTFAGLDATVTISGTIFNISFDFDNVDTFPGYIKSVRGVPVDELSVKITLADGRVIEESEIESSGGYGGDGRGSYEYWCKIPFVSPENVVSVEFYGVLIIGPDVSLVDNIGFDEITWVSLADFDTMVSNNASSFIDEQLRNVLADENGRNRNIPTDITLLPCSEGDVIGERNYAYTLEKFMPNSNGVITTIFTARVDNTDTDRVTVSLYDCNLESVVEVWEAGTFGGLGNSIVEWRNLDPSHYYCFLIEKADPDSVLTFKLDCE